MINYDDNNNRLYIDRYEGTYDIANAIIVCALNSDNIYDISDIGSMILIFSYEDEVYDNCTVREWFKSVKETL